MHLFGNALICASTVLECICCRIHRYVPDEGVALVLEDPDLLDGAEVSKGLLEELLTEAVGDAPAVDRAVGRRALVVHLVKAQRLRVHCR